MTIVRVANNSTTYLIIDNRIPTPDELPWQDDQFDAFIAVLDPDMLSDDAADEFATALVRLNNDWIESIGLRSEFLHDQIDCASVAIARQKCIGDGDPMTAWHEDLTGTDEMIEYITTGGHGYSENKLVVVVGAEGTAFKFAEDLREALVNQTFDE